MTQSIKERKILSIILSLFLMAKKWALLPLLPTPTKKETSTKKIWLRKLRIKKIKLPKR